MALPPDHSCHDDLEIGLLVRSFPGWGKRTGTVHIIFITRRSPLPAVRAFADHLAAKFAALLLND